MAVLSSPGGDFRWAYLYTNQKKDVFMDSHVQFFEMVGGGYKGKTACIGMRISDKKLIEMNITITEPMVVEEVKNCEGSKKKSEKNFCIIPATEYRGATL